MTNLSTMSSEFFIGIAKAGADWITASIDGIDGQYEAIRKPLKFMDTLKKIKKMHEIKEKMGWDRPVVKVQGIWPSIRENPSAYYNTFYPYVDLVAYNPLIDYLDNDNNIVYMPFFSCPQLYQRLVVSVDGIVLACANDEKGLHPVGDVSKESVYDIWHGNALNEMRTLHKRGYFREIEICRMCYLPRATTDDEFACVNDRTFIVKNYVGRSQVIGD